MISIQENFFSTISMAIASKKGSPFVFHLNGPILFSAPHGRALYRGGGQKDPQRTCTQSISSGRRVHKREQYTMELCLRLAQRLNASCMIWGYDEDISTPNECDLDPNFLLEEEKSFSPWHRGLVSFTNTWAKKNVPMLHIDIHGKGDRRSELNIDIGMKPMEVLWDTTTPTSRHNIEFVQKMKNCLFSGFCRAVQGRKGKNQASAEDDPEMYFGVEKMPALDGWWGNNTTQTFTHQAILLGVPSVMLEFPFTIRRYSNTCPEFVSLLANAIQGTYNSVIKPAGVSEVAQDSTPKDYLFHFDSNGSP